MSTNPIEAAWGVVVEPDGGESLWQPLPSRGHVTLKLTPENTPYDTFSCGVQVLPPGCHVRDHGHRQNHELIFVYEGRGSCTIEDRTCEVGPGTTILFGRHAVHRIENTGDVDMKLFWVFFPPGLEDWFRAIGRPRRSGEPMPAPFPRPENVSEIQERMRFVVPPPKE
jgi:mannose-6-phosphate isomerase-like protein (cupin superfamily)